MTQTGVRRQHRRWGVRAFAALLLTLGLLPQGMAAPPIRYNFDHLTTGFELIGQHRDLPCESCHANAIFKGTPKDCGDRKSTRLNSSHGYISYAVFCFKKKNRQHIAEWLVVTRAL